MTDYADKLEARAASGMSGREAAREVNAGAPPRQEPTLADLLAEIRTETPLEDELKAAFRVYLRTGSESKALEELNL